ncbi:MAG: hypothetical protein GTN99_10865, partial [Candidatus Dadabacteria bacterium]|nr:hypothetical protein [Candidatus Dadabacteria bacterium]NIT14710.1 hypothetical protein [Candidatus Dadabacteria bacterium]
MNNIKPLFEHTNRQMNIAVFVSGSGTNLRALCEKEKEIVRAGEKRDAAIKL